MNNKVDKIEREIQGFSAAELVAFRKWLQEFDAAACDQQTEEDVQAGKLDALAEDLYKCKNCNSPLPAELVKKYQFNVCIECGHLYPRCVEIIKEYFRIIQLSGKLTKASELLFKSETTAAVREAIITLESTILNKSGLKDLLGADLMAKTFSFKSDPQTRDITEEPKIKINDLSTISKRNEQDGVKFIAMGLMQGVRNIFMHSKGTEKLFYCIQVITTVDLLLKHIDGWAAIAD